MNEHNDAVVNAINKYVQPDDILYCLGDWAFGGRESILEFRRRLNVKTIHLILGNHDKHIDTNAVIRKPEGGYINAQDLFTSVRHYLEKEIGGQKFVLFHFPIASFHKQEKGAIHLHGHVHMTNHVYTTNSLNVCMDSLQEFRPYNVQEIVKMIKHTNG